MRSDVVIRSFSYVPSVTDAAGRFSQTGYAGHGSLPST